MIRSSLSLTRIKRLIGAVADFSGVNNLGLWCQRKIYGPHIRAIGYHAVQTDEADMFEEQVRWYARHFVNVGLDELKDLIEGRSTNWERPGLILSFDDGTRTHFETVAPILEKYGFTGWFFVPSGLLNLGDEDPDDEFSRNGTRSRNLSLQELRSLGERHIVGAHGVTHIRLSKDVDPHILEYEILESKSQLEKILGRDIDIFSWIGGEDWAYCESASQLVRDAYRFAFMGNSDVIVVGNDPYQLSRSNIESTFPMSLVRFQLSGLVDLYFTPRRKRVIRITKRMDSMDRAYSR